MCVLLIRLKKNGVLTVKLMLKKKKLHGNFVETFLNACDISFTSFVS